MNTGGLVNVNAENGKSQKMKTTGTVPNPNTKYHTANIKGNEMIVYGGDNFL